jgi:hypothetical protein
MKTKQERIIEKQAELIEWYCNYCKSISTEYDDYLKYKLLQSELASIQAEPEEEIYPKEFIEWLAKEAIPFEKENEIRWTFNCEEGIDTLPISEVFEYWKTRKSS